MRTTRDVPVNIGGTKHVITSDDNYLPPIEHDFEPEIVKLFSMLANDSNVVLDVGANIGCTALLFGSLAKNVYAFEPSPTTFALLEKNISRSELKNIFIQNIGLGANEAKQTLTFSPENRAGGFVSNQVQASASLTTEEIKIQRLDDVVDSLNLPTVDFIKIDVEGFEGQVLRGATHLLSTYQPTVVLELNHWCLNAFQRTSIPDFFDFLRSVFPILLAVDGSDYMDLHSEDDSYIVMYHHILHNKFPNILAAFDENQVDLFRSMYQHQFIEESEIDAAQEASAEPIKQGVLQKIKARLVSSS